MENIIENNKLIAEFLGGIKQPFEFPQFGYINSMGDWKDTFFDNQLKFHSNWSWLMSVVEKIETISVFGKLPQFFIMYDNREEFKGWYWLIEVPKKFSKECHNDKNRENTKIEAVYNACIEFVKWHNKN